jgi:hypothetical protein
MTNLTQMGNRVDKPMFGDKELVGLAFESFVDASVTATSRATFYNTKKEQLDASLRIHNDLMSVDRGIYGLSMLLPRVTDHSKQIGISNLLSNPSNESGLLTAEEETKLIKWLARSLPPQRMLKLFVGLKESKVNNSRSGKTILSSILNSPKLELWAVKYRSKLRVSLCHAWGNRQSSIIVAILKKDEPAWSIKEKRLISKYLDKFIINKNSKSNIYQCIRFIFKDEEQLTLPKLNAYAEAKKKIEAGRILPYEVLEGIRSTYHPNFKNEDVLKLTKSTLTDSQKLAFQKKAKEANVEVKFNPEKYDSVKLYLYAYEMGMTYEIKKALSDKAEKATFLFNLEDKKTGILVDCSQSMMGSDTQKLRPMATALAVRDVLVKSAKQSVIVYSGENEIDEYDMVIPAGSTSLAEGLIDLMMQKPDVIFILSDGYENSPAGRIDEVISQTKRIGVEIPVIQYSPVMAAETEGIRGLSDDIRSMPISSPESSALGLLKEAFASDPKNGCRMLLKVVKPGLEQARINDKLLMEN